VLEYCECTLVKSDGKVSLAGKQVRARKGPAISHSVFLSVNMDDDSSCEAGIIQFPDGKQ
jgi:hypothetical protein